LFRDGIETSFRQTDTEAAARSTLDRALHIGCDVLCAMDSGPFINCARQLPRKDGIALVPPSPTGGGEVPENVESDDLMIAA